MRDRRLAHTYNFFLLFWDNKFIYSIKRCYCDIFVTNTFHWLCSSIFYFYIKKIMSIVAVGSLPKNRLKRLYEKLFQSKKSAHTLLEWKKYSSMTNELHHVSKIVSSKCFKRHFFHIFWALIFTFWINIFYPPPPLPPLSTGEHWFSLTRINISWIFPPQGIFSPLSISFSLFLTFYSVEEQIVGINWNTELLSIFCYKNT